MQRGDMNRNDFLRTALTLTGMGSLSSFKSLTKTTPTHPDNQLKNMKPELATFGAVHLNVTNLERSIFFWKEYIGMKVRNVTAGYTEMGTDKNTLVVLYQTANQPFKNGYSGLYHLAIHPPNEGEFARVLARLITKRYPISPTDHTISKAIYLTDPDGITVEITLETPERFVRYEFKNGMLQALEPNGTLRNGVAPLDVESVLKALPDNQISQGLPDDTKVGHLHLYASNLEAEIQFYKNLGFLPNPYEPSFGFADLGAGSTFIHRIGLNTWQSLNKPQAPEGTAGMRFFTIIFDTPERLKAALQFLPSVQQQKDGYLVSDISGNKILLKA